MSQQKKLILTIKEQGAIQRAHWIKNDTSEFLIEVFSGEITAIKVISKSVLVISFATGELRLDIKSRDLDKIKDVD